jgi:hypothetical protein
MLITDTYYIPYLKKYHSDSKKFAKKTKHKSWENVPTRIKYVWHMFMQNGVNFGDNVGKISWEIMCYQRGFC